MPWGAAIAAGATLIGSSIQSNSAGEAAKSASTAELAGIESQERMFERSLELQEPYREAGYGAVEGLQGMLDPNQRASMLSSYYAGPEYQAYQQQAEETALRNAAATGNLRAGSTQQALASIAPQLGADYLSNQQNIMTGLGNWGVGAASQGSNQASMLGSNIAQSQQNIGNIQAQNAMAQGNIWGNAIGTLGGIGYNYFNTGG